MKRIQSLARVALAVFVVSTFFISCSQGLLPSWKTENPVVRMAFGGSASAGERAVARGTGYVYIKPIGGPDDGKNLLYGPYTVNWGKDFATTDLEPGTYSYLVLFHSSEKLDLMYTLTDGEKTLSVKDILSSTELMTFVAENNNKENETGNGPEESVENTEIPYTEGEEDDYGENPFLTLLGNYLGGKTTYGVSGPVILLPGKVTDVSMTLIPILGENSWLENYGETANELTRSSSVEKKEFFAISGNYSPVYNSYPDIIVSLSPSSGETLKVGTVAFYDERGKLVKEDTSTLIEVESSRDLTISLTEETDMFYVYVEYLGDLVMTQSISYTSEPDESLSVQISGLVAGAGKRVFIQVVEKEVFDDFKALVEQSENPELVPIPEDFFKFGIATLDSLGSATIYLINETSIEPAVLVPYTSYYVSALVDMGNRYDEFTIEDLLNLADGIEPYIRDYVTDGEEDGRIEKSTGSIAVIELTASDFTISSTISINGDSSLSGTRFIYALDSMPWEGNPQGHYIGFLDFNSYGNGTGFLYKETVEGWIQANLEPNTLYYIGGFIDTNGDLPQFNTIIEFADALLDIEPNSGDLVLRNEMEITNTNEQGRLWFDKSMFIPFSTPIESAFVITYSENGDPVLTAPSFEISMNSTLTVTAPADFTSYKWLLNGDELTGQTINICSFVPYDVGAQGGVNYLTIEVFDGTDWYSSVVEFNIPQI